MVNETKRGETRRNSLFRFGDVAQFLEMPRNLLLEHRDFLTILQNSPYSIFLQPGNFLHLLLIAVGKTGNEISTNRIRCTEYLPEMQSL
jgi:hypothetical protein